MSTGKGQQAADIAITFQRALALHQQGKLGPAEALYRAVIARAPKHFDALHLLGLVEYQRQNYEAAIRLIDQALKVDRNSARALSNKGTALHELKRYEEAIACYDRALALKPDYANAPYNRGNALIELGRHAEALASYDRALAIDPNHAEALNNRGNALLSLKRPEEALATLDRALAINPDYADALKNRGNALRALKRPEEALANLDRALAIKPDYAEALNDRGVVLHDLKRYEEALASYARALAIKPSYAEALINRGNALIELTRHEEALASYDQALAIEPNHVEALNNRGVVLHELKRYEEARDSYGRALAIKPDFDYARSGKLASQIHCCDWSGYDRNVELILNDVSSGKQGITPFTFLAVLDSPGALLHCAQTFSKNKYPPEQALWQGERHSHQRIRVAYLSADFHNHATAFLMAGLFEAHDKARFDLTAISFGLDRKDELRVRLERSFDRFIDVRGKSDREVALLLNELEIDIAVDLKGYTQDARTRIFAFRPAPIQVNYLGYPGTMGADYMDYILADPIVIPADQQRFYIEKVAYLPDCYQPTDAKRPIGEYAPTRLEAGLPEAGFVFCSFNNNYKIAPPVFDVWMRLLHEVEGSVLWLLEDNAAAARNLRKEAERRGVVADRLIFAPRTNQEDHLARHRLADLFLDTLPCNAHTTASDALWAGLPVVTCLGASFAGRVAASIVNAVGLPELITHDLGSYEALALALARDKSMLAEIRAKLAQNRRSFPLFDTERFTRHLESAYETMWARSQRGEPPAGFAVARVTE